MTREEIINGLKMSMDLTLFDPSTGEVAEPWQLNDINRTAYDAYKGAIELLEKQRWIPVTEIPPRGRDLMLKIHDKHNLFFYYHMGFYDGKKYFTYNFSWQNDKDLEIVGWQEATK